MLSRFVYKHNFREVECVWNLMAHGDAREGKWRGNWRMEWVASTLHTTSEHGVSSITNFDAHNLAASSRLDWRPRRFKWTRPFRRKTKSYFCACAITFQTHYTSKYIASQQSAVDCDNNVTTQNVWFFWGENFKDFEVVKFSMSAKTTQLLSSGQFCKLRYDTTPVKNAPTKRLFLYQWLQNAKFWVVPLLSQMSDIYFPRDISHTILFPTFRKLTG